MRKIREINDSANLTFPTEIQEILIYPKENCEKETEDEKEILKFMNKTLTTFNYSCRLANREIISTFVKNERKSNFVKEIERFHTRITLIMTINSKLTDHYS